MTVLFNHDHYNHLQNFSTIPNRDCSIEQKIPIPLIPAPVNYLQSYFMKLAHISGSYTVILSQDFSSNYDMSRHYALRTQRCTAHCSKETHTIVGKLNKTLKSFGNCSNKSTVMAQRPTQWRLHHKANGSWQSSSMKSLPWWALVPHRKTAYTPSNLFGRGDIARYSAHLLSHQVCGSLSHEHMQSLEDLHLEEEQAV